MKAETIAKNLENIVWVDPGTLKPDPNNPNNHTDEQIQRLIELIEYQGWRWPIVVSKQDGLIKAGHGRLLAAEQMKAEIVPVLYQDFESDEQAYAFMVSDNAISEWSFLDKTSVNANLETLGPDFDVDLLGIKDFVLDVAEFELGEKEDKKRDELTHVLEVHFNSESEMIEVYDDLLSRGLIVKCR